MRRPIGIILSAIILSLAALGLLLSAAVTVISGFFIGRQPSSAPLPHFFIYVFVAVSVLYVSLAVWAILTIIGILRFRSWARYSILVMGGGTAALSLFSIFTLAVTRFMMPPQPGVDTHITKIVFIVIAAFYAFIAGIGIWWLVYFNRRPIRELFQNPSLLSMSSVEADSNFTRSPIAIKMLGGFFLFSAVCCLPLVFLPLPAFILGFILPAKASHLLYLVFFIFTAFLGYGLFHLKEWARLTTIAFLIFGCCNVALSILPWYQAQFRQYMSYFISLIPTMPGQPVPLYAYTRTMIISSSLIGLVINLFLLWLLRRHRAAFTTPPPQTGLV